MAANRRGQPRRLRKGTAPRSSSGLLYRTLLSITARTNFVSHCPTGSRKRKDARPNTDEIGKPIPAARPTPDRHHAPGRRPSGRALSGVSSTGESPRMGPHQAPPTAGRTTTTSHRMLRRHMPPRESGVLCFWPPHPSAPSTTRATRSGILLHPDPVCVCTSRGPTPGPLPVQDEHPHGYRSIRDRTPLQRQARGRPQGQRTPPPRLPGTPRPRRGTPSPRARPGACPHPSAHRPRSRGLSQAGRQ